MKLTEYKPQYERYGRAAPIKRNEQILQQADAVLIFWDGSSRGTAFILNECKKRNLPHQLVLMDRRLAE